MALSIKFLWNGKSCQIGNNTPMLVVSFRSIQYRRKCAAEPERRLRSKNTSCYDTRPLRLQLEVSGLMSPMISCQKCCRNSGKVSTTSFQVNEMHAKYSKPSHMKTDCCGTSAPSLFDDNTSDSTRAEDRMRQWLWPTYLLYVSWLALRRGVGAREL